MIGISLLFFLSVFLSIGHVLAIPASCEGERDFVYEVDSGRGCTTRKENDTLLKQGMKEEKYRWPQGRLVYTITGFDDCRRDLILEAMQEITTKTDNCITFVERFNEHDYVEIMMADDGCWSRLGHTGGRQEIHLEAKENACFYRHDGRGVGSGVPAHELIHALGFTHEHERADRDEYIKIVWDNINEDDKSQFEITRGQELLGEYDYKSIMHYNQYAFSKNDEPTMIAKMKGVVFGQADELSYLDIAKLKDYYECK